MKYQQYLGILEQNIPKQFEDVNKYAKNVVTNVEGLKTLIPNNKYDIEAYRSCGFIFGNNKSGAVFIMNNNQLPKLVSTLNKVVYTANQSSYEVKEYGVDGKPIKTVTTYYGLRQHIVTAENKINAETGLTEWVETSETRDLNYGSKENPYVIFSTNSWNEYFNPNVDNYSTENYYRIVADLNFSSEYKELITQGQEFKGNIEGNNMHISGIRIYSERDGIESIGLFKELVGGGRKEITNTVKNLTLSAISVNATKAQAVGTLAGIVENFNLYNITLDSQGLTVIGRNAVGGIAGVIRGNIDIDSLYSNASATSTRSVSGDVYYNYLSIINGKEKSETLANVYYAGSVAGVVDAYKSMNVNANDLKQRTLNSSHYSMVRNVLVEGNVSAVGDTVGSAFGFLGEYTHLLNVKVDVSAYLAGTQYAAGIVGENRGVIENAIFICENEDAFNNSKVIAGIVGFNLGGLIKNVETNATVISNISSANAGGIVARNVLGYVINSSFNGKVYGKHVGGIISADYLPDTIKGVVSGSGLLADICKNSLPSEVSYTGITNFTNVAVGEDAIKYLNNNINKFYSSEVINGVLTINYKSRALGVLIGLTDMVEVNDTRYEDLLGYRIWVDSTGPDGTRELDNKIQSDELTWSGTANVKTQIRNEKLFVVFGTC